MSAEKPVSLKTVLYKANSIPEVLTKYENLLRSTGDLVDVAHAVKIAEYRNLITDKKFLSNIRKNFNSIYNLIEKSFPDIRFVIDGRCKSLISTERKIRKLLSENKSLDLLRDMFAFRILLFGENTSNLINTCYEIANKVIEYNLEKGFTLCEADVPKDTSSFKKEEHPNILIPEKSIIPDQFKYGVKDYILNPKENGYQSLHITFRTSAGVCFEIQIRTFAMHLHAESGEANHPKHKEKRYNNININLDKNLINIPGYGISPEGIEFDFIGLEKGLEVLKRQRTY